ncbi:MAG: endonuclease/exonuclease/phosphatase family protein, partial [Opitutales bacterium]|nr:endonuclease/exonuclease/phosphatase family protein [Opitutales bacterium]
GEDVLCLQEVDFQDGWWDDIKGILSDYPYTYQTINTTWVFSSKETSIAVLSKHPIVSPYSELVNTDPTGDRWRRNGQHVQIQVGGELVHIFHYHNTFDNEDGGNSSEIAGMEKFRDFILDRIDSQALSERGRIVALGDFNINGTLVDTLMPDLVDKQSDWVDHVAAMFDFENSGVYSTGASGSNISDHDAVWAEFDLEVPSPDPMTWAAVPASTSSGAITMEAAAASDPHEVEYYFTNTTIGDGSHDSGWQDSTIYIDSGLTEGATYSYTVMARDKSANANVTGASPSASATTTIVYVAPPYKESFENGIGDWVQSAGDDYDWMVHSGLTPAGMEDTPNAGPSGASDGTYYLYAEGHQGQGPYGVASVEASFDFSALTAPAIQFDYHMFGVYIKYLALDVYDGTSWTTDVWRKDNQQHFSITDPWSTALVDLSAYAGLSNVKLRFSTGNKQWFAADPAVDNICIDELPVISYANWEAAAFAAAPSGTDTSFTGNPDMDDWDNEGEWIFGTDPLTMDSPMKEMTHDLVEMSIDYTRRKSTGFNVFAQWSPDLTPLSWDTDGLTEEVTDDDGEVETVTVTVPMNTDQKFVRVKALQN